MRLLCTRACPELPPAAHDLLNEREVQLFNRMLSFDRRHSIKLFETVVELYPAKQSLQVAALLHDVGKGLPAPIHRVALVIAENLLNLDLSRWHRAQPRSFRGRLYSLSNHVELGARFLEIAGSNSRVVEIIRGRNHVTMAESTILTNLDSKC